ncbi:branched-chain amino acid transport system permease protein [Desulfovibrionales bacterium]
MVVGLTGILDLGYIAFYGVGAYTYALASVHLGLSFWLSLPLSALVAAAWASIVGYPTLRLRGDYLAIVTLSFGEIVRTLFNNWMDLTNGPNGILGIKPPSIFLPSFDGISISFELVPLLSVGSLYYIILGMTLCTALAIRRLSYSRIGRAWEAIREDQAAAELMGVNTHRLKLLAYSIGAAFGGLAGAFFAGHMRFVSPQSFTFIESVMVLAMVVLGGMGSILGVILGAFVLIILPEWFRDFESYRMLAFGGAMAIMMIIRPAGLWPDWRRSRVTQASD